jgi:hyperosmotically inducible protein
MRTTHWTGIGLFAVMVGFAPLAAWADDGPPDAWITLKAKIAVLTAVGIPGTDINVDAVRGHVTLHGTVGSREDQERAEKAARAIEGVREVRNLLQIVSPKQEEMIEVSDAQIELRIATALRDDDVLKGSSISVQSVNKGVVLLAGKAKSLTDHVHALEIAKHVRGVGSVHSEITSDDARADVEVWREYEKLGANTGLGSESRVRSTVGAMYITSATKLRLLADRRTPGLSINVDTNDGVVTLVGTVESEEAKRAAEAEARKVNGVTQVVNRIEVKPER